MNNDTIVAVSTPPGVGGIAVLRISGADAVTAVNRVWKGKDLTAVPSHTAHLGTLLRADGSVLDQCVATVFRGPNSYTGEDIVELSVHGSVYVQRTAVAELCKVGARVAEPGEFTRRAFAAGKIDLVQAESIADILSAESAAAHDMAVKHLKGGVSKKIDSLRAQLIELSALLELELDFSEEDVEFADRSKLIAIAGQIESAVSALLEGYTTGSAIKNGIPIAIVGPANAGKSSLFNALVGDDRAIVSDIHGTTRDIVDDTIVIGRHNFRIMDTAGLRHTDDTIEKIGIQRSLQAVTRATIVLYVTSPDAPGLPPALSNPAVSVVSDASIPEGPLSTEKIRDIMTPGSIFIHVHNKADLTSSPIYIRCLSNDIRTFNSLSTTETSPVKEIEARSSTVTHITEYEASLSSVNAEGSDSGVSLLKDLLEHIADGQETDAPALLISNPRQEQALQAALQAARETLRALRDDLPTVIVSQSLRATITALDSLTGQIATPTILQTVFSRFCIGK